MMRTMRLGPLAIVALGWLLTVAQAGMIITTNLPSGDAIINISGTADGARAYGGSTGGLQVIGVNQDDWYQPFNTSGTLLEYTFQPGTYGFRIIDQSTAATMFPLLTASQLSLIGAGAWTYNTPWVTDYLAFDSSAATNSSEHQLFAGAVTPYTPSLPGWDGAGFNTAADAYAAANTTGVFDEIVTGTGRYTGTVQTSYTFATAETLIFAVPDYYLPDNAGSVSVLVTPAFSAVPEPASVMLLASGLLTAGGFGLCRRRRRASIEPSAVG